MSTILVVDDEKDIVTLIRFLLERDGHQIAAAYNGLDALKLLGIEPGGTVMKRPDLIILDLMMPVMDGYAVSARLAAAPEFKGLPILVLTARGQTSVLFQTIANVASYVEKPFDPSTLKARVQELLAPNRAR